MRNATIQDKIIDYIKTNRVSTTEVADAMYKMGELDTKLRCLVPGSRAVGVVHYAPAVEGSNYYTHKYLKDAPKDSVVYVDVHDCDGLAIFGGLVIKFLMLYRQTAGVVVGGLVRDGQQLLKEKWPVWAHGTTPIGCVNSDVPFDEKDYLQRREEIDGSIIVADDCGVIIIPKEKQTDELYERLEFIEWQEDVWFDCIDRRKWDTFDTVCLKKYEA
jgi:4-hydroxy-4-methyl-2-oxoglutarate aldolase